MSKRAIDQFDYIIDKLSTAPHTRRAQAITWKPDVDPTVDDPACLQRMWFRIYGDELRMNVHMRSNDAYKAAFMNMWAFTDLQRHVAEAVTRRTGRALRPGPYAHIVDSFHIYGSYFREFEGFLQSIRKRSFADRTWDSTSEMVQRRFRFSAGTDRAGARQPGSVRPAPGITPHCNMEAPGAAAWCRHRPDRRSAFSTTSPPLCARIETALSLEKCRLTAKP